MFALCNCNGDLEFPFVRLAPLCAFDARSLLVEFLCFQKRLVRSVERESQPWSRKYRFNKNKIIATQENTINASIRPRHVLVQRIFFLLRMCSSQSVVNADDDFEDLQFFGRCERHLCAANDASRHLSVLFRLRRIPCTKYVSPPNLGNIQFNSHLA